MWIHPIYGRVRARKRLLFTMHLFCIELNVRNLNVVLIKQSCNSVLLLRYSVSFYMFKSTAAHLIMLSGSEPPHTNKLEYAYNPLCEKFKFNKVI